MNIILIGAPGCGKGTQAANIAEEFKLTEISTGAMLRKSIADGNELGKIAENYIKDGKLIPDSVMIDLVMDRVSHEDCKNGFLLDGFPRTLAQAEAMTQAGINVDIALMIHVSDEKITERLSGRRTCGNCSMTYHVIYKPSDKGDVCQSCDSPLIIREDDTPEVIKNRLSIFRQTTAPAVEYYNKLGKLIIVEGAEVVQETTERVLTALRTWNDKC